MSLRLSDGKTLTLKDAIKSERDILSRLRRSNKEADFSDFIWSQNSTVEALCAHHLGLQQWQCSVQDRTTWMKGQFNLCILVLVTEVSGATCKKVFRCPMAHKVAEEYRPGAMDEKVRVEVANYAFVEANCPEIPVPHLAGFGLSNNAQFTHTKNLPWLARWCAKLRRGFLSILPLRTQSPYIRTSSKIAFGIPYILLDFVESKNSNMLSDTWKLHQDDPCRRKNFLHGLSRLILSLARVPQPRIGCLRLNDNGSIGLTSPPLLCANMILESEGAPHLLDTLPSSSGQLLHRLLQFRREAFRIQQNAARDDADCRLQMSHFVILELIMRRYVTSDYKGPFLLQFTDLHASNIFVDEDWNIKSIIDLEFVCSLPPDMLTVPYWLTVDHIDEIIDHLDKHQVDREEFLQIFESEEKQQNLAYNFTLTNAVRNAWHTGGNWIWHCFTSVDALPSIVEDHLWPRYGFRPKLSAENVFTDCLSHFWSESSEDFVTQKLLEKIRYDHELRDHYKAASDSIQDRD